MKVTIRELLSNYYFFQSDKLVEQITSDLKKLFATEGEITGEIKEGKFMIAKKHEFLILDYSSHLFYFKGTLQSHNLKTTILLKFESVFGLRLMAIIFLLLDK